MTVDVSKATTYTVLSSVALDVSKFTTYTVVVQPFIGVLDGLMVVEAETGGADDIQVDASFITAEAETGGSPNLRTSFMVAEVERGALSVARCSFVVVEVFCSIAEEPAVPTDIIPIPGPVNAPLLSPGVPGITFSSHKKPAWRTDVASAVSGREVRVARMQVPKWHFELKFDFLDSRDDADPADQMQTIAGFFNTMRGKWQNWLYTDPTDYLVRTQQIGIGDGAETGFYVLHSFSTYTEPVGQINFANLMTFVAADVSPGSDTITVANHGLYTGYGPVALTNSGGALPTGLSATIRYWVISTSDDTFKLALSYTDALAGTPVDISAIGSGTNTMANSIAVYNNGTLVPTADYTITMPNQVIFDTAPALNDIITVDCQFYFVCRFSDDMSDFEQFMYKLWTLETLEFETDIP